MIQHSINDFVVGEPVVVCQTGEIRTGYVTFVGRTSLTLSFSGLTRYPPYCVYKLEEAAKIVLSFIREAKCKGPEPEIAKAHKKAATYYNKPMWITYFTNLQQVQNNPETPVFYIKNICTHEELRCVRLHSCLNLQFGADFPAYWLFSHRQQLFNRFFGWGGTQYIGTNQIKFDKGCKPTEKQYWFGIDRVVYDMNNKRVGVFKNPLFFYSSTNSPLPDLSQWKLLPSQVVNSSRFVEFKSQPAN